MTEDQIKGLTSEQASKEISRLVSEAYAAIAQAEAIADAHELNFDFDLAYGMGGTYIGDKEQLERRRNYGTVGYGSNWAPSSMSC